MKATVTWDEAQLLGIRLGYHYVDNEALKDLLESKGITRSKLYSSSSEVTVEFDEDSNMIVTEP